MPRSARPAAAGHDVFGWERVRAGNGLDATRTDALLPQSETGKINCVRLRRYGRLSPGAGRGETQRHSYGSWLVGRSFPRKREFSKNAKSGSPLSRDERNNHSAACTLGST